jgi:glycerol-3-phosphate O-acyltransferase / dihydroxyacetone phosphate acyltransferase
MMTINVKSLRLGDMIFNRGGTWTRRVVVFIFSVALKLFFRRIETANAEIVPPDKPVIFVMNHPNGLIDPALVFVALPRKISFLAKSTLFRMPVISFLLRTVEALPLYRRIDAGEDVSKNQKTFSLVRELLKKGGAIAIFPEGVSHNSPKLLPLKTGAARIALGTISVGKNPASLDLKILPVGLFYTSKTTFRSEALLHFGEPFGVSPVELDADGQPPKKAVKELNERIEKALREVTVNAESDVELENANKAEKLFSSVSEGLNLEQSLIERFDFLKKYVSQQTPSMIDKEVSDKSLERRIFDYQEKLRELEIEPENLSLTEHSFWYVFRHFLLRVYLILIFLPIAVVGVILHFPAYQLGKILAFYYTHHGVDDIVSTVKILSAMLFMPLTWLMLAVVLYFVSDWRVALLSLPLAIFSGYVAMRSLEEFEDLRGWFKAVWLFYLKRRTFLELLTERRALSEALESKRQK